MFETDDDEAGAHIEKYVANAAYTFDNVSNKFDKF